MKKTCTRCGEIKDEFMFQVRRASPDGLTAACKACLKKYDDGRNSLPHRVKARMEYQKTQVGIAASSAAKARWRDRNKDRRAVHTLLGNAVKYGKIKKMPCEKCGSTVRIHGHHEDYSKPLDVKWLCAKHHAEIHKKP